MGRNQAFIPSNANVERQLKPPPASEFRSNLPQESDRMETLALDERNKSAFQRHANAKRALDSSVDSDITLLRETISPSHPQESTPPSEGAEINLSETLDRIREVIHEPSQQNKPALDTARHTLSTIDAFTTELNVGVMGSFKTDYGCNFATCTGRTTTQAKKG